MQLAETSGFEAASAEAFNDRIAGMINDSAVVLMLSIGHRTGLLDLMSGRRPETSEAIAEAAQLSERYVREWLAVMVTGGVVDYLPASKSYYLPPEHAASLTREGALGNLAIYAQFPPLAGAAQEKILGCFRSGEGLGYRDYPCFHAIMAEDSGQNVVAQLFDSVLPLAPELEARLEAGIDVMDAGCGSGYALTALARRYPNSCFLGYDLEEEAVARARKEAAGLANIRFEARDLSGYDERDRFDLVTTFDAVHDQKDPAALLAALYGSLRKGGIHLMQDIGGSARLENNLDFPFAAFLYAMSCMHCTAISLGQGGAGLGTMWGWETAEAMLKAAGFGAPERVVLPHDPMNVWFVSRKD